MANLSSKTSIAIIGAITFVALLGIFRFPFGASTPQPLNWKPQGIVHIVMFEFKDDANAEQVKDVCDRMLALKDKCLHPTTKKSYVQFGIGGKQNSPEGLTGNISHVFVEKFANEQDRAYYLNQDPVHLAFVKSIGDVVKRAQVVDFTPGLF